MNSYHEALLQTIKQASGKGTQHSASDSYLGSGHFYYSIRVPEKRAIAKAWAHAHPDISLEELITLIDSLYGGPSFEEKTIASILLEYVPQHRQRIPIQKVDGWLDALHGWAEIDTLCQGIFTAEEVLVAWETWQPLLIQFSQHANIVKRRASLVLLTTPVTQSADTRLKDTAFEIIDSLKPERDILITKAISWLLRSLIKHHKKDVAAYLLRETDTLPKIAVRETTRKLETGKK